jgi:hypothetical protein
MAPSSPENTNINTLDTRIKPPEALLPARVNRSSHILLPALKASKSIRNEPKRTGPHPDDEIRKGVMKGLSKLSI